MVKQGPQGISGADRREAMRATTRTYDDIAEAYAERAHVTPELRSYLEHFIDLVPAPGRVVDAGSGPGHLSALLAGRGLSTVAHDSSREMVRLARRHVPVIRADLRQPPFAEGTLDGIWSCASLLHVARRQVPATLRAWRLALQPNGVLGLSTAVAADEDEGWELVPYRPTALASGEPLRRWFVYHSPVRLLALLADAGFDVVDVATRESNRRWLQVTAFPSIHNRAEGCGGRSASGR